MGRDGPHEAANAEVQGRALPDDRAVGGHAVVHRRWSPGFCTPRSRQGVRSRHPAFRSDHQEHPLRHAAEPARLCRPHHPRCGQSGGHRPGQDPEQRGTNHPFDLRAGNRPERWTARPRPARIARQGEQPTRPASQERADLDVQGPQRPVAARQHGSHPQRAVLLQCRLPSPCESTSVLGVLDIVYSLDDDRSQSCAPARSGSPAFHWASSCIAALLVGFFVHRLVYLPLRDLESGAQRLSAGNLDQPIPVRSGDEFGKLASFVQRHDRRLA